MSTTTVNRVTPSSTAQQAPLLSVRDLKVHFPFARGPLWNRVHGMVRAVDGVSFDIAEGETLGLVGESGCGKSTTARAILNLVRPTGGEVWLRGERIDGLDDRAMRPWRSVAQIIFQDPFASLNPRMTVGRIVSEPMQILGLHSPRDRQLEVLRLLEMVGLNPRYLNRYPHEFSGGQRQRIGIARALAVQPRLLLCDEPVSALDVSIQAQVINLLMDVQQKLGLSLLFIAHDLAVVRHIADRIGVMYLGKLVEVAPAETLYNDPRHPYTRALMSSALIPDPQRRRQRVALTGEVPSPEKEYAGCRFAERCPIADGRCSVEAPPLAPYPPDAVERSQEVACFFAADEARWTNAQVDTAKRAP
jgi:oligopeptide transport system ATP-binding protein